MFKFFSEQKNDKNMSNSEHVEELSNEIELPSQFTDKIISAIKNKQSRNSNEQVQSEQSQIYSPKLKNWIKLERNNEGNGNNANGKIKHEEDRQSRLRMLSKEEITKRFQGKTSKSKINNIKKYGLLQNKYTYQPQTKTLSIYQTQKILKDYFQTFITTILQKMQDITNAKLNEINYRLDSFQHKLHKNNQLKQRDNPINSINYPRQIKYTRCGNKRQKYIKNREKVEFIRKIERRQLSIEEVASICNVKLKVVQFWLANREEYKKKELVKMSRNNDISQIDEDDLVLQL